ncbi:unnamed protein product [Cuscuta campestris]|uniref:F-box associated beta-propeller type 3 domain-containing protein n=1 Tax=Cuscuta campestris TaxID=132261 RepID=A0A484NG88_9ASTE|nr:unnamed protein product [Cuscuta campestris]
MLQCHLSLHGSLHKRNYYVYDSLGKKLRKISLESSRFQLDGGIPCLYGACGPLLHIKHLRRTLVSYNGRYFAPKYEHNIVFNPITRQLAPMKKGLNHYVSGVFFNESRNEYNYLRAHHEKRGFRFRVYNLAASRADEEEIACAPFLCRSYAFTNYPVTVGKVLYLMVIPAKRDDMRHYCIQSVLVFDMDSGTFRILPHPGFECRGVCRMGMYLFVHDGHLCLCRRNHKLGLLGIYVLEDHANWEWVQLAVISLPIPKGIRMWGVFGDFDFMIFSVGKDELLVSWFLLLFLVNLKDDTVTKIKTPYSNIYHYPRWVAYRSTLAAPRLVWDQTEPLSFTL